MAVTVGNDGYIWQGKQTACIIFCMCIHLLLAVSNVGLDCWFQNQIFKINMFILQKLLITYMQNKDGIIKSTYNM